MVTISYCRTFGSVVGYWIKIFTRFYKTRAKYIYYIWDDCKFLFFIISFKKPSIKLHMQFGQESVLLGL